MTSNAKGARFVRSPEAVAAVLGVACSKTFRRELGEFRTWADWPKQGRNGWPKDEILAFYDRNADKIAANRIRARLADPNAFSKVTAADLTMLQRGAQPTAPAGTPGEPLPNCNTQTALARALQAHFGNRITIVIDDEAVSSWRRGDRFPATGTPLPPAKTGNYWSAKDWAAWVEQYILPHHRPGTQVQGELIPTAKLQAEKVKAELEQIEHARLLRAVEMGRYIEVSRAANIRRGELKLLLNLFRRLLETDLVAQLRGWLMTDLTPHRLAEFQEYAGPQVQAIYDRMEQEVAALAKEEVEQAAVNT